MAQNLTEKRKLGNLGEDIACKFLMKRGFWISGRNYLKKWGEIDIVAQKGGKTYFVEVKTVSRENLLAVRRATDEYRAEDNIHPWKLKRLARTIQSYLLEKKMDDVEWQLDALIVELDIEHKQARVRRIEDIVL